MRKDSIQDILPFVEQPSRYLGTEINTIKKDPAAVRLHIALAFPDLYEIGTSHFGLSILYHVLNRRKEIAAERVFAPGLDMEARLRSANHPLVSLESQLPLREFDIVGFSLLYELNYTNILNILDLSKIPFYASQRNNAHPLIIAGGSCTCNPEPVADVFDAMVIGDGEDVILEMSDVWLQWRKDGDNDKETLLKQWSELPGVYIPAFFETRMNGAGFQTVKPRFSNYTRVLRAIASRLDQAPFPDAPVVPFGKPIHDRLRLEISRGCTRGCRFCQAGMIYRPVRERSMKTLIKLSEQSLAATGYEDISLLSLSTGDYECIAPLLASLMARCQANRIAVSLPSLRAGTLSAELMKLIKKVRKTGFTIAPEAGSQRLRDTINKNITAADIQDTVKNAFDLGWQVIKLYFMIGLPSETQNDLRAMVDLVKDLRKLRNPRNHRAKINVSLATFIPKPHTPFQWVPQHSLMESRQKLEWVRHHLNLPGIHVKWQDPRVSLLEGLWSRGDRRLSRLLVAAYDKGCKFDGWSDRFRFDSWMSACTDVGVDIDFFTTRVRDVFEPLPWDHIHTKVEKSFLRREWARALRCERTRDCRDADCNRCGVCDFESVAPEVFRACERLSDYRKKPRHNYRSDYARYKIIYAKRDQAKYFGHLEMVNIFLRALRRAEIRLKYSEGYHPKPRVSFEDPLPVGIESTGEIMYVSVAKDVRRQSIIDGLNRHLPAGLNVLDCRPASPRTKRGSKATTAYDVFIEHGFFDFEAVNRFLQCPEFTITRTSRRGTPKSIDLRALVLNLEIVSPKHLRMNLKTDSGTTLRPQETLRFVFQYSDDQIRRARIVKSGP
ncbi:MAG: TIGR03960 family B12-binding radical SAM protein [Desulfobacterales bacterium]|jgi:radical SAM family uncharacterized protein/radical SAM-linked protein